MRYDVFSGILVILSIIDFVLPAPVLVQDKRQACVDEVHTPRDTITVLGKRGSEELERLVEEYFKTSGKPVESSDAHASSSSAPSRPDDGSTSAVQAPSPNQASLAAYPNRLSEPSSSSSTSASVQSASDDEWWYEGDGDSHGPVRAPTSSGYGLDHELTGAHEPKPNPKKRPWTDLEPDFDWMSLDDVPPPTRRPATLKEFGQTHEYQMEHEQQLNPGPSTDWNFDSNYHPVSEVHTLSTGTGPQPSSELTDPELHLDHQSSIMDFEQVDPQAAIYAAKGKAKESRRISGITRDVGNTARRELQPDGRPLDPGE